MSYTKDILNEYLKSDGATVIEPLPKLKKEAKINFVCNCGKNGDKTFV